MVMAVVMVMVVMMVVVVVVGMRVVVVVVVVSPLPLPCHILFSIGDHPPVGDYESSVGKCVRTVVFVVFVHACLVSAVLYFVGMVPAALDLDVCVVTFNVVVVSLHVSSTFHSLSPQTLQFPSPYVGSSLVGGGPLSVNIHPISV